MPVHKIQGGYQYGKTGKRYYGKDAKKKAERQALAIRLSGYTESVGSNSNNTSWRKINEPRKDSKQKRKKSLRHDSETASIGKLFVEKYFTKG